MTAAADQRRRERGRTFVTYSPVGVSILAGGPVYGRV